MHEQPHILRFAQEDIESTDAAVVLRIRIERCFSKLKHFRRFAPPYGKYKTCFAALVALVSDRIILHVGMVLSQVPKSGTHSTGSGQALGHPALVQIQTVKALACSWIMLQLYADTALDMGRSGRIHRLAPLQPPDGTAGLLGPVLLQHFAQHPGDRLHCTVHLFGGLRVQKGKQVDGLQ